MWSNKRSSKGIKDVINPGVGTKTGELERSLLRISSQRVSPTQLRCGCCYDYRNNDYLNFENVQLQNVPFGPSKASNGVHTGGAAALGINLTIRHRFANMTLFEGDSSWADNHIDQEISSAIRDCNETSHRHLILKRPEDHRDRYTANLP